ncbi:hypothetical protein U1Q18_034377 [Sarracenia purpurea var. burkii]
MAVFRKYRHTLNSNHLPEMSSSSSYSNTTFGGPVIEMATASFLHTNRSYAPLSTEDPGPSRAFNHHRNFVGPLEITLRSSITNATIAHTTRFDVCVVPSQLDLTLALMTFLGLQSPLTISCFGFFRLSPCLVSISPDFTLVALVGLGSANLVRPLSIFDPPPSITLFSTGTNHLWDFYSLGKKLLIWIGILLTQMANQTTEEAFSYGRGATLHLQTAIILAATIYHQVFTLGLGFVPFVTLRGIISLDLNYGFCFHLFKDAFTVGLPPDWVDVSEEITANIQRTRVKMTELVKAHAKALTPSFEDGNEDQRVIEALSLEITDLLRKSEKRLQKLSARGPSEDSNIRKNVQHSLATDLQSLSMELRKEQSTYLKRLKQQKEGDDGLHLEMNLNENTSRMEVDEFGYMDFNEHQMAKLKTSGQFTAEREREIRQVTESIFFTRYH